jgi:glycine/D-amino acid oxidase-like deaminating enzyme
VAVVGAGIIGCAIARELAVRGVAGTVIDPRPVAGGATQASAGMLAPHVEAHDRGALLDLGIRSLARYDDWIAAVREESGLAIEFRRIGTLETGGGKTDRSIAEHGYVVPGQLAVALARAAERHGCQFVRDRVERITHFEDSFQLTTSGNVFTARQVVLAAGAWMNTIEGVRTPPLRPVRGQLLHLGWPGDPLTTIVWGPDCYVVPRVDGTVLVGATVEEVGFDERPTADGVRQLLDAVCELLPAARTATFLEVRVGLRPATPDELPVIGADPEVPELFHASGHYRNGVLLAPITAKLIADLLVDRRSDPILENFRVNRFSMSGGSSADGSSA